MACFSGVHFFFTNRSFFLRLALKATTPSMQANAGGVVPTPAPAVDGPASASDPSDAKRKKEKKKEKKDETEKGMTRLAGLDRLHTITCTQPFSHPELPNNQRP